MQTIRIDGEEVRDIEELDYDLLHGLPVKLDEDNARSWFREVESYLDDEHCLEAFTEAARMGDAYKEAIERLGGWRKRELACHIIIRNCLPPYRYLWVAYRNFPTAHALWQELREQYRPTAANQFDLFNQLANYVKPPRQSLADSLVDVEGLAEDLEYAADTFGAWASSLAPRRARTSSATTSPSACPRLSVERLSARYETDEKTDEVSSFANQHQLSTFNLAATSAGVPSSLPTAFAGSTYKTVFDRIDTKQRNRPSRHAPSKW